MSALLSALSSPAPSADETLEKIHEGLLKGICGGIGAKLKDHWTRRLFLKVRQFYETHSFDGTNYDDLPPALASTCSTTFAVGGSTKAQTLELIPSRTKKQMLCAMNHSAIQLTTEHFISFWIQMLIPCSLCGFSQTPLPSPLLRT